MCGSRSGWGKGGIGMLRLSGERVYTTGREGGTGGWGEGEDGLSLDGRVWVLS